MNRKTLEEFIDIYQTEECLWKVKCKEYHNRDKRNAAYGKLIEKLRETTPDADRDMVVKKINNLRTTYRKELKKVQASKKSGAGAYDVYVPKLWYFENLAFLHDQETPREGLTNIEENESENSCHDVEPVPVSSPSSDVNELEVATEGNSMLDISYPLHVSRSSTPLPTNSTTTNVAPSRPTPKKCRTAMSDEVLMTINEHFKKPREQKIEDKHDVFGKNVAHKLRGLDNLQRIMAEKIINDALFEAEMGNLTHHHKLLPVPVTNTQFPIQHNVFPQPSATPRTVPHTMPHTSLHLPSLSSTMDPLAQAISVLNEIP
ncbi:uncharacterized protein LOC126991925 [Eriocheir sinensis]|uniref:uncharacterized protein LOC126991818 n=1 Tax=Eriocheir sinensis TaxID=95602 RepID=UPI0021C67CDC|nr:uncharacterized protein LOC126991818 [Eriocheir sinensis]XP_050706556.1 uncharacterized protein LOC126991925 [Eriocheir sinensis]